MITGTINSADDIDFYFTDSAKNQFTFNSKVADVPGVVQLSDTSSKNIYAYLVMSHDSGCSAVSDIFHLVWTTNSIADFWESQVSLYPNPATNFVLFSGDMAVKNIEILDVFGRQIKSEIPNGLIYGFDVSDLETGNYFIVFEDDLGNKFWSKLQKL